MDGSNGFINTLTKYKELYYELHHEHRTLQSQVLIVTPEVTYLPHRMLGCLASFCTAKAGGLADMFAGR